MSAFEKATAFFQGRHTLFVTVCVVIGVGTAWFGKLDANLVALLLGLQGMILAHSAKDDYFKKDVK
jgi:hypothetical protein